MYSLLAHVESCSHKVIKIFHVFFFGKYHMISDVLHDLQQKFQTDRSKYI